MSRTLDEQARELFGFGIDLPLGERAVFVRDACVGNEELRRKVEALFAADENCDRIDELLRSPLTRPPSSVFSEPLPRARGFHILRPIAQGGMGVVYEAKQEFPTRTVALKIIRPGSESSTNMTRFSQEAMLLAKLQHPSICQIYGVGLTDDGRQYIAMEYVRGESFEVYSRNRKLKTDAILGLFAQVCDAVQYAHNNGVIHRDLKPENILIDELGRPKVLDFGVARTTSNSHPSGKGLTVTGLLIGTLNYMSPEHLTKEVHGVDLRSDVYALGVILFELLAGRLPYTLEPLPLIRAMEQITDVVPPKLGGLNTSLRGDVEIIVAKALEKDPELRYQSADELSQDIRFHLAQMPIRARCPSILYRLEKLARRNIRLVGAGIAVLISLIIGLISTAYYAYEESQQRTKAVLEKDAAEFQAYRARMAAVVGAHLLNDVVDTRRQLDAAPKKHRGWEWQYFQSQIDGACETFSLDNSEARNSPLVVNRINNELTFGFPTLSGLRICEVRGGESHSVPFDGNVWIHVNACETSRGILVAGWTSKNTIELIDRSGCLLTRVTIPEAKSPQPIALSADGSLLATHWEEGVFRRIGIFETNSGKRLGIMDGHKDGIWSIVFSPDGKRVVSCGEDAVAKIWDTNDGSLIAPCLGHQNKVLSASFRNDGQRFVTASSDGTVRQWNALNGQEIEIAYTKHLGEVATAIYSPDGQFVASAGTDRVIRLWKSLGQEDIVNLRGHTGPITRLAFTPDTKELCSLSHPWIFSSPDNTLKIWDLQVHQKLPVLRGHSKSLNAIAFSPDGRLLASCGWDDTIRLWDPNSGTLLATLQHPAIVRSLAFGSDSKWLLSGSVTDSQLRIWDCTQGELIREIPRPSGRLHHLALSPDCKQVGITVERNWIHYYEVIDIETGASLYEGEGMLMAYSLDGKWVATLTPDRRSIHILESLTHSLFKKFVGHDNDVFGAVFCPQSTRLASFGADQSVRLWNLHDGNHQLLSGHSDDVFSAAFTSDSGRLATAGRDRAIWIWDLSEGQDVAKLLGHSDYISSLAFSPDGDQLASGSGDLTVRIWNKHPLKRQRPPSLVLRTFSEKPTR